MNLGLKIKELMVRDNIEIPELADMLGKSKQAIYDMLQKQDVNTSLLRKLSSIFKVPMTYFFDEDSGGINDNSNIAVSDTGNYQAVTNKGTFISPVITTFGNLSDNYGEEDLTENRALKAEIDVLKKENETLKNDLIKERGRIIDLLFEKNNENHVK